MDERGGWDVLMTSTRARFTFLQPGQQKLELEFSGLSRQDVVNIALAEGSRMLESSRHTKD